jgi:hypothetical protein
MGGTRRQGDILRSKLFADGRANVVQKRSGEFQHENSG